MIKLSASVKGLKYKVIGEIMSFSSAFLGVSAQNCVAEDFLGFFAADINNENINREFFVNSAAKSIRLNPPYGLEHMNVSHLRMMIEGGDDFLKRMKTDITGNGDHFEDYYVQT